MSDRLKQTLGRAAEGLEIPYADVDAVIKAGRGRVIRRRVTMASTLVVVALGAMVAGRALDLRTVSSDVAPATEPSQSSFETPPEVERILEEEREVTAALNRGDYEHARELGEQRLSQATDPDWGDSNAWDYGNAIHIGHLILGHVELRTGNVAAARRHLLASAETPGSPQLGSFGPNMSLARDLLLMGQRDVVMKYLTRLEDLWPDRNGMLPAWKRHLRAGAMPDFGANLVYGLEVAPIEQIGRCPGCQLPPRTDRPRGGS